MRRIVEPDRIVYLERHWKLSLLMFAIAAGCVGFPLVFESRARLDDVGGLLVYAAGFLLVALSLQHRSRAILIEPSRGVLLIVERRFLRPSLRRELRLADVSIAVTSALETRLVLPDVRRYWIWIEISRLPRILFAGFVGDQSRVQGWVQDLRQDLRDQAALGSGFGSHQNAQPLE